MRRLLNTLYVFTENAYLALDGENVVAKAEGKEMGRIPLHTLESIASFSYRGASPALMGKCVECGVALNFFDRKGRFLAAACGESKGNVLLRKAQYEASNSEEKSLAIARNFIVGKLFNSRWVLERAIRDHSLRIDVQAVSDASGKIKASIDHARTCGSLETLRGIEGDAAAEYFGVFGELILRDKEAFGFWQDRKKEPIVHPFIKEKMPHGLVPHIQARLLAKCIRGDLDGYPPFLWK